jgi:hypothetical protein
MLSKRWFVIFLITKWIVISCVRFEVLTALTMRNAGFWRHVEAIRSSETSVHTRSTRQRIPENVILHCNQLIWVLFLRKFSTIQSVPGGKVNILGGHSIGHSKQKTVYMHMCSIPNGFRDGTVQWNSCISETFRNRTRVHIQFLLRITDTMTSQNIDLSSWDFCIEPYPGWRTDTPV